MRQRAALAGRRRLPRDSEMSAAVPRPAPLVVLLAERGFLSVRDRLQPLPRNTQGDEIVKGGFGTTLPQGEVVLDRPALVAMAVHSYGQEVELLQVLRVLGQDAQVALMEI